jgi:hypothetical protein
MDQFRLFLSRWIFSPLQGVTLSTWWRALRDNGFAVHPAYWPRALATLITAANNSLAARHETLLYSDSIARAEVREPVFILGHYRSGTTHLHNLLGIDPRFAFVNNYQASFPRTFLTTEAIGARVGALFTMRKRPHDNVRLDLKVPTEDELALCADTLLSPHMAWHFPRRAEHYNDRFLTFETASEGERERWIRSLQTLARKLTIRYDGRRLVMKSPLHTARIPLLLAAFPDARFIHVHRNPFTIFQSTANMETKVEPLFRYQFGRPGQLEERILRRYRLIYDSYFASRAQIPDGRLVEIGYAELAAAPVATLEHIYQELDLDPFDVARPTLEKYIASIAGYRTNRYPRLPEALRQQIYNAWRSTFDEWDYPSTEESI